MKLDDIPYIQPKDLTDSLVYIGHSLRPETVFVMGTHDGEAIKALILGAREKDENGATHGVSSVKKVICTNDCDQQEVQELLTMEEFNGTVEFVDSDIEKLLKEKIEGNPADPENKPEWENITFDIVLMDVLHYRGTEISPNDQREAGMRAVQLLDLLFDKAMLIYGIRTHTQVLWDAIQKYGGNSVCIVSAQDDGTITMYREDAILEA